MTRTVYQSQMENRLPKYPALPGVEPHRRKARLAGSIAAMKPEDVRAYAEAVWKGIYALNRSALMRNTGPETRVNCASGTSETDGKKIIEAMRRATRNRLLTYRAPPLPDRMIREKYAQAMKEKRANENSQAIAQHDVPIHARTTRPIRQPKGSRAHISDAANGSPQEACSA